jgi:hypothetical protein
MENLFVSAASEKEQIRKKQNAFLNRLINDLKSAYVNIKHTLNRHYESGSMWEIGVHYNDACTHSFSINSKNEITFESHTLLVFNTSPKYEKIKDLVLKYPKSSYNDSYFRLRIEGITEDNIKDCIADIVRVLELDGFTLRY